MKARNQIPSGRRGGNVDAMETGAPRKSTDFSVKRGKTNKTDKERKSKPRACIGNDCKPREMYTRPRLIGGFEVNLLVNMYS